MHPFHLQLTKGGFLGHTLRLSEDSEKSRQTEHDAEDKAGRDWDMGDDGEASQRSPSEGTVDQVGVVVTHKRYKQGQKNNYYG